jgi:O-antigen/teichoic acid export membrane protein
MMQVVNPARTQSITRRQKPARAHRLATAYLYSLAGVGLVALTGVVTGVLSSRTLGPIGRGELTALLLLPGLFGSLGNPGISQAVGYLDAPSRNRSNPFAGAALIAAFGIGLILCLCLLPFLWLLLPNLPGNMLLPAAICLLAIPISFAYSAMRGSELASGHFRSYNLLQVCVGAGQVLFMLLFWGVGEASAATFALAVVLAVSVVLLARVHIVVRLFLSGRVSCRAVVAVLRKMWEFTQPELAGLVLLRCDVLLLAPLISNERLGFYTVALALAFGQAFIASPMSQVCFHSTSSAPDRESAVSMLARQFRIFQVLFFAVAVLGISIAPALIRIAFGSKFVASVPAARILILSMAIWSCSQILEGGLRGLDLTRLCVLSNLLGLIVILSCSPWLVRTFGIDGMAAAALGAQVASLISKLWMLRLRTGCELRAFWAFSSSGVGEVVSTITTEIQVIFNSRRAESLETVGSL